MADGVIKAHDPGMTVTPVPFVAGGAAPAGGPPGAAPAKAGEGKGAAEPGKAASNTAQAPSATKQ